MIRGIALLLLATATSARSQVNVVHVPRVEVPELDVEVPDVSLAMAGEDESDDDDADQALRDADKSRRDAREWHRDSMRGSNADDGSFDEKPTARAEGKDGSATLPVKGPVTVRLRRIEADAVS